jgi:hypothetical protein
MTMNNSELKTIDQPQGTAIVTPNVMLAMAVESGADIDKLEKLMDLQERWQASEAKKAFVSAMSQFRAQCISVAKTRSGHNCKYAGLAETIEQVSPVLVDCGLSHRWETKQEGGNITVECHLTHIMGHSESAVMTSQSDTSGSKNSIQAIGSAISYLQRYTFFAVTGLASREMDDDGVNAVKTFISANQENEIHAFAVENDLLDKSLKWLAKKGINSLAEIPANEFKNIFATIKGQAK